MFSGCYPASVTDLLTLCWAPKCRLKVKRTCLEVASHFFLQVPRFARSASRTREAKRNASEELAHNHVFWCKGICNMFLSWLHMGCIISQHLTLKCIINSASKLSASLTSCAQDCNLNEGQQLLTRLCTFFMVGLCSWGKRLFKETPPCMLKPCFISHTILISPLYKLVLIFLRSLSVAICQDIS